VRRTILTLIAIIPLLAPAVSSAALSPEQTTARVAALFADNATIPAAAHVARCGPRGHVCRFVLTTQTDVRCVARLHLSRGLTAFRCSDEATIPAFAAGIREFLLR
jgi:hypothetical protein